MKNRIKKGVIKTAAAAGAAVLCFGIAAGNVRAEYHFVQTQASEEGSVSIEELPAGGAANGYSLPGGCRVSYTISKENWNSFDDRYGGYFLTGNQLEAGGGCQFAYHTSGGAIWEDGAIILGRLSDAKQVARCDVAAGTVSCSFEAASLSELPAYIAYAYAPASGAYVHITEEYGTNSHIWHYKSLKDAKIERGEGIDGKPPVTSAEVIPTGKSVTVDGKLWSEGAAIRLYAEDNQSRPGGICLYQNGQLILEEKNVNNETVLQTSQVVKENGSYEMNAYDQLNNRSANSRVEVSCIDKEAPVIKSAEIIDKGYVTETKIVVRAIDNGCGLNERAYSVNGGPWEAAGELTVCENGVYRIKVRDALGNESSRNIMVSNIDKEAPEISVQITPKGTMTTYQGNLWSTDASLTVDATDEKSGMRKLCILDKTGKKLEEKRNDKDLVEKTLRLEKNGIKNGSYKIWAADCLNQVRETDGITISHVDSQPPVIQEIQKIPQKDGSVLLLVEAVDAGDGIGLAEKAYSFDGGKTWQKEREKGIGKNADYEIVVRDRLNQSVSERIKITEVTERKEDREPDNGKDDGKNKEEEGKKEPDQTTQKPDGSQNHEKTEPDNPADTQTPTDTQTPAGIQTAPDKQTPDSPKDGRISDTDTLKKKKNEEAYTTTQKEILPREILRDADEKVVRRLAGEKRGEKENAKVQKLLLAVLAGLFAAALSGILLYLFLYYRRYSCILYGIDEKRERKRLCRLLLKEKEDGFQVEVPEHRLGALGTGNYVFVFHPSFVKEEIPSYVIILIDGKAVKEKLSEEIQVTI